MFSASFPSNRRTGTLAAAAASVCVRLMELQLS